MKPYNFSFVITKDSDGFYMANVLELPGCHTQAKSLTVLIGRIKEAIQLYFEVEEKKKHTFTPAKFVGLQQIEVNV